MTVRVGRPGACTLAYSRMTDRERAPEREWQDSFASIAAAVALIALGGWLRLHDLPSMEFKNDEREALVLASQVGLAPATWPDRGMLSSGGVANAPLFTWIVAGLGQVSANPLAITAVIAVINTLCLLPLWRWALRRIGRTRAMLLLAIISVSPFAVLYSRKIWTQNLLLPGVLLILWGIEWLRTGKTWRGVIALTAAALVAGQLHQSGPIALALLPLALLIQWRVDRATHRAVAAPSRPTPLECGVLAIVIALNAFFWFPYLRYLATLPVETITNRVRADAFGPFLLWHIGGQIAPSDLFHFFAWDRDDFLDGLTRYWSYRASMILGTPLFAYGLWRWLRAPTALPVIGIWWILVIVAFMLARITTHTFYTLILAPAPAFLAAGGFDPPALPALIRRVLSVWRIAYVVALLSLTVTMQRWISDRGGATPDYGISYRVRYDQARNIVALLSGRQQDPFARGFTTNPEPGPPLNCDAPPPEVRWLVGNVADADVHVPDQLRICERWIRRDDGLRYQWQLQMR